MPANNTCWLAHYWAGRYGNLGHLYSPSRKERPLPHLPYALDNGAFSAWRNGGLWDREAFIGHVARYAYAQLKPLWLIVPDVVADAQATLAKWEHWAPLLRAEYPHLKLAIAVQDGMDPETVDRLTPRFDVIFVGGSTEWKWKTMRQWAREFPRVHVGRVNGLKGLRECAAAGVESCDGTGWFRGRPAQILELGRFLADQAGHGPEEDPHISYMVGHSRLLNADQMSFALEVPA